MKTTLLPLLFLILLTPSIPVNGQVPVWEKHEIILESDKLYDNPLYEVTEFSAIFTSPSGRIKKVNGFWDGGKTWKIRFMPDEAGEWNWETKCSDGNNKGLNSRTGKFSCIKNNRQDEIYRNGAIIHPKGKYYLTHNDGTPFFWLGCTAWNGALKSTPEEWDTYLKQRKANHYNVIQLVTTQWRGCESNEEGLVPFEGAGRITINPDFFKRMDARIDRVNDYGLVASPVILWALPSGAGRHLSPGYYLPVDEAVLLAKYIVARYQGNHVVWELGGDGRYYAEFEDRWKEIGRRTFRDTDHAPVTLHPHGRSFVGDLYAGEEWYSLMGYQSSHSNAEGTVNWINKGHMSQQWDKLRPMPYINMEPCYEQINTLNDQDVRNASYWSLFATPVAGVTYGANGIWPWLRRDGEEILNHRPSPVTFSWANSIVLPGSLQMGYLAQFFKQFEWWNFVPANELLVNQPGETIYNHWLSSLATPDRSLILVYIPVKTEIELFNPAQFQYSAQWFNPVTNKYSTATVKHENGRIRITHPGPGDVVLVLKR